MSVELIQLTNSWVLSINISTSQNIDYNLFHLLHVKLCIPLSQQQIPQSVQTLLGTGQASPCAVMVLISGRVRFHDGKAHPEMENMDITKKSNVLWWGSRKIFRTTAWSWSSKHLTPKMFCCELHKCLDWEMSWVTVLSCRKSLHLGSFFINWPKPILKPVYILLTPVPIVEGGSITSCLYWF